MGKVSWNKWWQGLERYIQRIKWDTSMKTEWNKQGTEMSPNYGAAEGHALLVRGLKNCSPTWQLNWNSCKEMNKYVKRYDRQARFDGVQYAHWKGRRALTEEMKEAEPK